VNAAPDLRILAAQLKAGLCPFHAERTPSFCVYNDHYHCFGCGAHGDVLDWIIQTQGMTFAEAVRSLRDGAPKAATPVANAASAHGACEDRHEVNVELARRIWCESVSPFWTPVEQYLHQRGVRLPPAPVIRWHPRCPRADGTLPAMVALMTDPTTGVPCGIHRTFLRPDGSGKASIDKPKMMLGAAGVIRLVDNDHVGEGIGLAEGIETSLTCMQVIGWGPVWAACSRGGMATFPVLPGHALTVFADGDAPGIKAARVCAQRWADTGADVLIHAAPDGQDWNDVARSFAA
jgi:hypothetical protein